MILHRDTMQTHARRHAMALSPSTDPEALVRVTVQVTRAQLVWLKAEARRRQVRSVPAVLRQLIQTAEESAA